MKERGIIMSGDNPKLILEGRKTQTRRIVKIKRPSYTYIENERLWLDVKDGPAETPCPYGVDGDRLWVRETWQLVNDSNEPRIEYSDGTLGEVLNGAEYRSIKTPHYKIRPSIHMPRWASRITLEILKVRVERLQDISEDDVKAEGITMPDSSGELSDTHNEPPDFWSYRQEYAFLWDSLHGKGAWDKNPWVWVIEFSKP